MDETRMMTFVHKAVADVGTLLSGSLVVLGDRLGLYRAMAGAGALTPDDLAARTGTTERYVREWLSAQAATGYVVYEGDGHFSLPDEHAIPLTDETSPGLRDRCLRDGAGVGALHRPPDRRVPHR